jgi:hypothetical protein
VGRARQGAREGAEFVRGHADLLVGKVRQEVAEPVVRALRDQAPRYARWVGGQMIHYALAATLFCLAAVFLLVGAVQGLEQVGLPPYLTWILGGAGALGVGLVVLRLSAGARAGPSEPGAGQDENHPP